MEPAKEPAKAPAKGPIQDLTNVAQPRDTRYITILNVLSCFGVVVMHVNLTDFNAGLKWVLYNVIECIFTFAVPVFFMISGVTLMDYRKRYNTKTFIKKRIIKTLIPFLIWSLIALALYTIDGVYTLGDFSFLFLVDGILNARFLNIYWFFIPLFIGYAWIIVLSLIPDEHKQKAFLFLVIGGFIAGYIIPFIHNFINIKIPSYLLFLYDGRGYLIFVLLGYLINKSDMKLRFRMIIYCLGLAGFLTQLLGTHFASFQAGKLVETYRGKLNGPCFFYSLAVFTFFRYFRPGKFFDFVHKICKFFAPMTFGIFLIHRLVLGLFLDKIFDTYRLLFRTFGAVGTFLLCAAIVWIIQHIPLIKKLIPK